MEPHHHSASDGSGMNGTPPACASWGCSLASWRARPLCGEYVQVLIEAVAVGGRVHPHRNAVRIPSTPQRRSGLHEGLPRSRQRAESHRRARAGGTETVLVDFGTSATRSIRIEFDDMLFGGLDVDPGDTVTAGAARPTLGIHGDSWVEGASATAANGNDPHLLHMACLTGRMLDADCVIGGIGGTGYVNGATATPPRHYNATDRTGPLVTTAPKTLLVFGTINDNGTGLGAAVTEFIQARAADMPNTKLIIVGPESYNNSTNAGIGGTSVDAQMQTACAGQPNVLAYISPRQEQWITGTGNTVTPAGDGTADLYHNGENLNHLSRAGNRYYAEKLAAKVAALVPA